MTNKIKKHMDWVQVFTIIIATFSMFLWGQRESRSEIREIRREVKEFKADINKIMIDFHGRMCTIEEKYHQLDRRK